MSQSTFALRLGATASRQIVDLHTMYGYLLCFVLIGYATLGKGFAYVGIPPLFIGEIVFFLGILVVIRSGCGIAMLASIPSILLILLITLVLMRTIPYIGTYGINAARDSVVAVYGLFAFIVIALLLERPERLSSVLAAYSRFAWFYGLGAMALLNSSAFLGSLMPAWPFGGIPLVYVRLGEGSAHLAGAAVFAILGLRRVGPMWMAVTLLNIGMAAVSRGAMLTSLVPIGLVAILGRERKRFGLVLLIGSALFAFTYGLGLEMPLPGGRSIGPQQIINGFESVIGNSDKSNLDGTKTWRLNWWQSIVDYTVNGPYFWTGKGFGVNLAEDDNYEVGHEIGGPPVRSPHSVNMTMLARAGVPGLILWVVTLVGWFGMLFRMMVVARRHGDFRWADIFLWIACYGSAIVVDASFDVALEGPMLGIWFWCLFGLGIAATMIYRTILNAYRAVPPT
jgi:hypothetical protein